MNHHRTTGVLAGILAITLGFSPPVMAKEKKKAGKQGAMDPAKMEMMKKATTPNENHKRLDPFIGNWTYTSSMWMTPGSKPEQSTGTQENSWVLGGRFVKEVVKGTAMGQAFEGHGKVGYDNVRGEYQAVWADDMSTGIMMSTGQWNEATKTLTMEGTASCPFTGEKNMWTRSEWKLIDNDNNTYATYSKGTDGKEFKMMEIAYKRAK
jgi:hypothetical protein